MTTSEIRAEITTIKTWIANAEAEAASREDVDSAYDAMFDLERELRDRNIIG